MPADARVLLAALPDAPRWVETRALLLLGSAVLRRAAHADATVVLDPALPSGFLVGEADTAPAKSRLIVVRVDHTTFGRRLRRHDSTLRLIVVMRMVNANGRRTTLKRVVTIRPQ